MRARPGLRADAFSKRPVWAPVSGQSPNPSVGGRGRSCQSQLDAWRAAQGTSRFEHGEWLFRVPFAGQRWPALRAEPVASAICAFVGNTAPWTMRMRLHSTSQIPGLARQRRCDSAPWLSGPARQGIRPAPCRSVKVDPSQIGLMLHRPVGSDSARAWASPFRPVLSDQNKES
jgi:hypothetical protein